jgi:GH25 family lysozyme M1 (1,4-beta-N-acetylmuramidase)
MVLKRSTQFLHRACGEAVEVLESRTLFSRALGIDVSGFQPTIDWSQVKASGRTFAWTKSTEGVTFNDSTYTSHINGANAAGVLIGAYHYARYDNNTASAEVSHFLSVAGNQVKAGYLAPMLDVENPVAAGDLNTTKAQISQWVNDWCNGVYNATGVKPIVYTYISYASTYLNSTVTQWPLWMANYNGQDPQTGAPNGTSPWSSWQLWQYSSTTPVLGIGGTNVSNQCDVDVYKSDATAFQNAYLITAPEITVTQGGANIADGQASAVSFGTVNTGTTKTLSFTVKNDGGSFMTLGSVSATGGFTVTDQLVSSLLPGASDTFTIQMPTSTSGTKSGAISFSNNDSNENPFNFNVTGTVVDATPPAPTGFAASDGLYQDHVALSWSAAGGAAKYQLYRNTTNDPASATVLAQTTGTSYDDFTATANTTYYYWAASIDSNNVTGNKGTVDSGYADTIAPSVNSRNFQSQFGPAYISFTFSESVGSSISVSDLQIASVDSFASSVPAIGSCQWIAASNTAKFYLQAPLADGDFHATLSNVHDAASNAVSTGGSIDFHFLTGDANGDRTVNALDFNALASHFGFAGAGFAGGDFDFSGAVDTADFSALAARWNQTLPAATQPLGVMAAPSNLFAAAEIKDAASDPGSLV